MDKSKVREPFFARFLEGQFPKVKTDVKAGKKGGGKPDPGTGPPFVTLKYPSDDDEDPILL
jgi:hypothetical protein